MGCSLRVRPPSTARPAEGGLGAAGGSCSQRGAGGTSGLGLAGELLDLLQAGELEEHKQRGHGHWSRDGPPGWLRRLCGLPPLHCGMCSNLLGDPSGPAAGCPRPAVGCPRPAVGCP